MQPKKCPRKTKNDSGKQSNFAILLPADRQAGFAISLLNMKIRQFEEISNNAWPCLQSMQHDGWLMRFANGVTKRANSINLLYPSTLNPEKKIDFCEEVCKSKNIPATFKITAIADPSNIDDLLEKRGYYVHSTVSFQTADLKRKNPGSDPEIVVSSTIEENWIKDFIRLNGFDFNLKSTYIAIMERVLTQSRMVSIKDGTRTIGVGLGVVEGPYLGLFDIVTDRAYRRKGFGTRLVNSLLSWGMENGAETAYLQVLTSNILAQKLYVNLGFKEAYLYWYRMQKT